MFGLVRSLAVFVIFGTSFIDKFIKGIFVIERKILQFNFPPVPILAVQETGTDETEEQQDNTITIISADQEFNQELVRVARILALKPSSKISAIVATDAKGIVKLDVFTRFEQRLPWKCTCSDEHLLAKTFLSHVLQ